MLSVVTVSVVALRIIIRHNAESPYAECPYTYCRNTKDLYAVCHDTHRTLKYQMHII
jgi:hypothetical protein